MAKQTVATLLEMKKNGQKVSQVTCYDYSTACLIEECGIDIAGMSMQEILESSEVFAIPDGRYLIVES